MRSKLDATRSRSSSVQRGSSTPRKRDPTATSYHVDRADPNEVRAVVLADKLHNLISIQASTSDGRPVWASTSTPAASGFSGITTP